MATGLPSRPGVHNGCDYRGVGAGVAADSTGKAETPEGGWLALQPIGQARGFQMQNIQTGIESNIGRLVEESLAALNEVDHRIQALRAGLIQAVPALAHQAGGPGLGFNPSLAAFGNLGRTPSFGSFPGAPFASPATTTAFVPTPMGLVPVTVPLTPGLPGFSPGVNAVNPFQPSMDPSAFMAGFPGVFTGSGFRSPGIGFSNVGYPTQGFGGPGLIGSSFRTGPFGPW